ncbi:MAG: VanZ family protein [Akkermansiaceae bacterium]|nr:VanZ family protein [Akkermansiaceae bacterium]MCP5545480.1 VanZ family protein [Akkermansiaceae bacterium]MCP5545832.1 VanZ family protein [Akkermansiaceae bacterium]
MKRMVSLIGAVVMAFVIVTAVIVADSGTMNHWLGFIHGVPFGDKAGHMLLAGGLSFFCHLAARGGCVGFVPSRITIVLFVLFALEEASQAFVPSRHFDLMDLACDFAGLCAGQWLAARLSAGGSVRRAG